MIECGLTQGGESLVGYSRTIPGQILVVDIDMTWILVSHPILLKKMRSDDHPDSTYRTSNRKVPGQRRPSIATVSHVTSFFRVAVKSGRTEIFHRVARHSPRALNDFRILVCFSELQLFVLSRLVSGSGCRRGPWLISHQPSELTEICVMSI